MLTKVSKYLKEFFENKYNLYIVFELIAIFILIFVLIPSNKDDVNVDIKTCFGNKTIAKNIPLEEYLAGVLYGEESPTKNTNIEYLKAFVIFARTYSLKRGKFADINNNISIKSCSSDQNWCDPEKGCYREQTISMFNDCINYSLKKNSKKPYYTAKKCANRVTTFPGNKNVSNKTFVVKNSSWPSNYSNVATSTANRSVWKKKPSESYQKLLKSIVAETEGLVIKDNNHKIVTVGYMLCNSNTSKNIMCMNKAKALANKGYSMMDIIKSFTKKYKNIIVEDYRKNV